MNRLFRRLLFGLVIGVGIYAVGTIVIGVDKLVTSLASFRFWLLLPVLGATLSNYALRYLKWAYFLHHLGLKVPTRRNVTVFLSGLSMVITPGKIGELLKAYLLREAQGIPLATTAPVVVAERLTDLIALLLLMSTGVLTWRRGLVPMAIVGGAVLLLLLVVSSRQLSLALLKVVGRLPGLQRIAGSLEAFYESSATLLRPTPLLIAVTLSVLSWFFECLGTYVVLRGFPETHVPLLMATFVYAASTIGGLPTPGGLGLTDGGMVGLLSFVGKVDRGVAAAATLLVRLATLWFAVVVGVLALLIFRREVGLAGDIADL
ncbi:MAG: flippase-like domain-containing protein [Deltaproteobacteria bacterium]|nr:flippase-like domain-containing protein [Deltaproteobacteria bacterium]